MNIDELQDAIIAEVQAAGIQLVHLSGVPNFGATLEALDEESTKAFARILCSYTNKADWRKAGLPDFFSTGPWKRVRYKALVKYGNRCQCCGASPRDGAVLQADHIKPRSKYPELALSLDNLQVLCKDCNQGKSNVDETDWRSGTSSEAPPKTDGA